MKKITLSDITPAKIHAIVRASSTSEALKSITPTTTSKSRPQELDPSSTTFVFIQVPVVQPQVTDINTHLQEKFRRLAKQWRVETRHVSSIHEKSMNLAYQKIIGMGHDVLPYIFRDFQQTHDDWLWALHVITEAEPAPEQYEDFDEVVEAWLNWARENDYLA